MALKWLTAGAVVSPGAELQRVFIMPDEPFNEDRYLQKDTRTLSKELAEDVEVFLRDGGEIRKFKTEEASNFFALPPKKQSEIRKKFNEPLKRT